MTTNKALDSKNSGRKPSNKVDVCGPKSEDASRSSIKQSGIDHCDLAVERDVIDQFFAAQLSQNESEATIRALRPQVEQAVQALIVERGLPKNFTGIIPYHGFKIRVQRPTSFTWEKNNNIHDANLEYYKRLHACYETIQSDAKELRADLKRTAEKLAKAYPNSESIKHGFTVAIVFGKEVAQTDEQAVIKAAPASTLPTN